MVGDGQRPGQRCGVVLAAAAAVLVSACATAPPPGIRAAGADGRLPVVAAENVWGSLAAQLGGERVTVHSIISGPDADPHDYEPTARDARTIADARYAVVNGAGYDPWARRLLDANPTAGRGELDVGALAGVPDDGNPHQWYAPAVVDRVLDRITDDYRRLDPAGSAYYTARHDAVRGAAFAGYHRLVDDLRARYGGTPIGASESIVAPLADGLGLRLLTPPALLQATAEGNEPSVGDKRTADEQIRTRSIAAFVVNGQDTTPDVDRQVAAARAAGIPVTTVTETLTPPDAPFQDWQAAQLSDLEHALAAGTGR